MKTWSQFTISSLFILFLSVQDGCTESLSYQNFKTSAIHQLSDEIIPMVDDTLSFITIVPSKAWQINNNYLLFNYCPSSLLKTEVLGIFNRKESKLLLHLSQNATNRNYTSESEFQTSSTTERYNYTEIQDQNEQTQYKEYDHLSKTQFKISLIMPTSYGGYSLGVWGAISGDNGDENKGNTKASNTNNPYYETEEKEARLSTSASRFHSYSFGLEFATTGKFWDNIFNMGITYSKHNYNYKLNTNSEETEISNDSDKQFLDMNVSTFDSEFTPLFIHCSNYFKKHTKFYNFPFQSFFSIHFLYGINNDFTFKITDKSSTNGTNLTYNSQPTQYTKQTQMNAWVFSTGIAHKKQSSKFSILVAINPKFVYNKGDFTGSIDDLISYDLPTSTQASMFYSDDRTLIIPYYKFSSPILYHTEYIQTSIHVPIHIQYQFSPFITLFAGHREEYNYIESKYTINKIALDNSYTSLQNYNASFQKGTTNKFIYLRQSDQYMGIIVTFDKSFQCYVNFQNSLIAYKTWYLTAVYRFNKN